jgi:hypothetical protein
MKLATLNYTPDSGWSGPFPALDSPRTLVLAFGWSGLADELAILEPLLAAYPAAKLVGCSTAGEIAGASVRDASISVAVARFDSTDLRVASAIVGAPADCRPAGREIASRLDSPDLSAVFIVSDGVNVNGSDLLRGLNEGLDPRVVVTGGMAGDGPRFRRTWVLERRQPRRHRVVAVGLYGSRVRVDHGSRGGWDTFGGERIVTRSDGNVLFEIDGRPALRLYKEHMGELANGLPASALKCPVALHREGSAEPVVRTILAIDEGAQSMTFAGDIPQGSRMQFMQATFDRLIGGASDAARVLGHGQSNAQRLAGDGLAIAISCVGRRLVLGKRAQDEVAAVTSILPKTSALVGFYSYGEFSPHGDSGRCELHNQTMTLTQIREG